MANEQSEVDDDFNIYINRSWKSGLLINHHVKYFHSILKSLSNAYEEYDTQRMTFLHFAITSLDLLGAVDKLSPKEKKSIIDWIYSLQVTYGDESGFLGSSTFILNNDSLISDNELEYTATHITMTYAALVTLITLGDDLSRINKKSILKGVARLQNSDGSFKAGLGCHESDLRFIYCAVCICYILNDFGSINIPKLVAFIRNSFTYEGSFGSGYGTEGHAAYTFCAVASLCLLEKMNVFNEKELKRLKEWCILRQTFGFIGRPNKDEDTCYSYWVGGTLALLDILSLINKENNVSFLLSNQNPLIGGFGKSDSDYPDPLHTFMGIAGLALVNYDGLNDINPSLTMSENAVKKLKKIQELWTN